jgi:protease-4
MAMKSHPLLSGCLITVLVVLFFVGVTVIAFKFLGKDHLTLMTQEKVGVVEIKGVITDSRTAIKQLDAFRDDPAIKAIVVRINSPGGAVGPSQEILREIEKIKPKKKIVASLGTLAASGGYYIACGANLIMANKGTATGSIGVIMQFTNVEGLTKKVGLDFLTLKSGRYKDVGSPFRPMTPEEKAYMQQLLDNIYQQFLSDVARNRKIPLEKLKSLAEGKVYTGEQAKQVGLVDTFGNLPDAIEKAGRLAGIKGKVEAAYPPKEGFSVLRLLLGEGTEDTLANLRAMPYPEPAFLPTWFR